MFNDFLVERMARDRVHELTVDARTARTARIARMAARQAARAMERTTRRARYLRRFPTLLGWWLRVTGALVRYPAAPARMHARLGALGFPTAEFESPSELNDAGCVDGARFVEGVGCVGR